MQIILHIGQPKTASTTIQFYCDRNRRPLAAQGVLYPTSLGEKKSFIATFLNRRGRRAGMFGSPETVVAGLRAEFSRPFEKALLSDETIYRCRKENKQKIKDLFGEYATSWRILCYVRRPDEHIVSSYQQTIRNATNFNGSFEEFYAKRMNDDYYRYNHQMERWAEIFGADSLEVRVFHRKTLQGGPVEDFIRWIGLDPATLPPDIEEAANESVDRVGTEILRFLNACEAERRDALRGYDLEDLRRALRGLSSDDRLRLDTERARRLQERFRKDHERLAARYLAPDHAAILLAPPAERPVQAPIAPGLVLERLQAVLGDDELARRAADEIERRLQDERARGPSEAWGSAWTRAFKAILARLRPA
ncbi:MAG TPA: hypothetical protein VHL98_01930 [Microvirga sp.]|jgi:hypothetical protein|nr:hypothetical protein [Microvirga sp.]